MGRSYTSRMRVALYGGVAAPAPAGHRRRWEWHAEVLRGSQAAEHGGGGQRLPLPGRGGAARPAIAFSLPRVPGGLREPRAGALRTRVSGAGAVRAGGGSDPPGRGPGSPVRAGRALSSSETRRPGVSPPPRARLPRGVPPPAPQDLPEPGGVCRCRKGWVLLPVKFRVPVMREPLCLHGSAPCPLPSSAFVARVGCF